MIGPQHSTLEIYCGMVVGVDSLEQPCCNRAGMPWFQRSLEYTTTDYVELRVCGNEGTSNEDIPFSHVEIYIK